MPVYVPSAQAVAATALLSTNLANSPAPGPFPMGASPLPFQALVDAILPITPIPLTSWLVGTTYAAGVGVVFGLGVYVSLAPANLGNQPDVSPAWWALIFSGTSIGHGVPGADTGGSKLTLSADPITGAGTIALANTAVAPGNYGDATHSVTIAIDQQGRITLASAPAITGTPPGAHAASHTTGADQVADAIAGGAHGLMTGAQATAVNALGSASTHATADFLGDPGANGIPARTGAGATTARTITGTANEVAVSNGDGVGGNPTIALDPLAVSPAGTYTYSTVTVDTKGRVTAAASGAAPSSSSYQLAVHQVGHGLATGDAIRHTGAAWAKAKADAVGTLAIALVVWVGADDFIAYFGGAISGLAGLVAGNYYYVSDAASGALTATEPTAGTSYSNPILFATSATMGIVLPWRPSSLDGVSPSHASISVLDSPYTAAAGALVDADTSGGAVTVNLPAAATCQGQEIVVCKTTADANAVTVDPDGAETINGAATLTISSQWASSCLRSTGATWRIV